MLFHIFSQYARVYNPDLVDYLCSFGAFNLEYRDQQIIVTSLTSVHISHKIELLVLLLHINKIVNTIYKTCSSSLMNRKMCTLLGLEVKVKLVSTSWQQLGGMGAVSCGKH